MVLQRMEQTAVNKDQLARQCFKGNKNTVISWVLMASYAYYILGEAILSDSVFDGMTKYIYDNWDDLEHHHKHLFTKEDMKNGSLFQIGMLDYPLIIKNSTEGILNER